MNRLALVPALAAPATLLMFAADGSANHLTPDTAMGYTLTIASDATFGWNAPRFTVKSYDQLSDGLAGGGRSPYRMSFFRVTIGDLAFNYDAVVNATYQTPPLTGPGSLTQLDDANGGDRHNGLIFSFDNPTGGFSFNVDIDSDSRGNSSPTAPVMFNNGSAPNATVEARFVPIFGGSSEVRLIGTLPDVVTSGVPESISVTDSFVLDGSAVPIDRVSRQSVPVLERVALNVSEPIASPTPAAAVAGASLLGLLGLRRRR